MNEIASETSQGEARHSDWPKTLEWVEKLAHESLKARFATADLIAKDAQTTLTVLLAGIGGSAAYAAKLFGELPTALTVGSAAACAWLIVLAALLVRRCMSFRSYPALYQDPANLLLDDTSIDEIRHAEITNIQARVVEAKELNDERAAKLNKIRTAAISTPLIFVMAAVVATFALPRAQKDAVSTTKVSCVTTSASGVQGLNCTATSPMQR